MSVVLFSNEAERGVLSGILHDPVERFDQVHEQVPEGAFYFPQNLAAFQVLADMRQRNIVIEPRTFAIRANELGKLAALGGEESVNDLVAHRPTALHFKAYLHTLKGWSALRQVNAFCDRFKGLVYEPGSDPADLVDLFQVEALGISLERNEHGPRAIGEVLDEIDADLAAAIRMADQGKKISGWETGLARVDEILQGIEVGDRYVIAGLSNTGKTAREMQMVRKCIEQGQRVLLFMLDGKDKEAIIRLYAEVADVELGFITAGHYKLEDRRVRLERLKQAKAWLVQQGIFIDDRARSIQEINAITRRMKKKEGIHGTFIDYFGRCTSAGFKLSDKTAMLASVADQWARCIDDLHIFGVMLAQAHQNDIRVGEPMEKGPGSLKDCKTLYDVATKGEGLSREKRALDVLKEEELRIPDSDRAAAPPLRADEQIILDTIIKSKNTRLGEVWTRLQGSVMRFRDLDPHARIGDARNAAMGRLIRQVEHGAPNYASRDYQGPRGRPRKDNPAPPEGDS